MVKATLFFHHMSFCLLRHSWLPRCSSLWKGLTTRYFKTRPTRARSTAKWWHDSLPSGPPEWFRVRSISSANMCNHQEKRPRYSGIRGTAMCISRGRTRDTVWEQRSLISVVNIRCKYFIRPCEGRCMNGAFRSDALGRCIRVLW